ncbi:MAG TPA: TIGR02265 family protein [Myxococcales bacterium]|nr:TIGR02265 family protein [Myxococcales bacterium]
MAHVGGNVILARRKFVLDRGGEALWERVLRHLPEEDAKLLRRTLLVTATFPLALNLGLDQAIAKELHPGDPTRAFLEMGRASAEVNLRGPQRAFVREGDPHALLSLSETIYAYYYGEGRRAYRKTSDTSATLTTHGAPRSTPGDCLTVVGWHQRAIELCGGRNPQVRETQCRSRGQMVCEYECSWE